MKRLFSTSLLVLFSLVTYAIGVGDRVLGQWGDQLWYPARVVSVSGDQYTVQFDDGDKATLPASKVKSIDWRVGTRVQCNWKLKGLYFPGRIAKKVGEKITIHYDDGEIEESTISICRCQQ